MSNIKVLKYGALRNPRLLCINGMLSCNRISPMRNYQCNQISRPANYQMLPKVRSFSTGLKIDVNKVMKQRSFKDMAEEIEQHSENHANMTFEEFVKSCGEKGLSESDADVLADSLETLGSVVQVRDEVAGNTVSLYLKPKLVEEQLLATVDPEGLRHKERKKELATLEEQQAELSKTFGVIKSRANMVAKTKTAFMAMACVGMLGGMARCIWWTYSWDIMEPITYFAGAGISTCCMFYVVYANEEYETESFLKQWKTKEMESQFAKRNFNVAEYQETEDRIKLINCHISPPKNKSI